MYGFDLDQIPEDVGPEIIAALGSSIAWQGLQWLVQGQFNELGKLQPWSRYVLRWPCLDHKGPGQINRGIVAVHLALGM